MKSVFSPMILLVLVTLITATTFLHVALTQLLMRDSSANIGGGIGGESRIDFSFMN